MTARPERVEQERASGRSSLVACAREAPNQLLCREVNERGYAEALLSEGDAEAISFVCECGQRGCDANLRLSGAAYDAVRRFPTRFLLAARHASASDERVVADSGDYLVVEKVGPSARVAITLDPRKRQLAGARLAAREPVRPDGGEEVCRLRGAVTTG